MCKVFAEYKVKPEYRADYLNYMRRYEYRAGRVQLLEGTDQPGLFVEIWEDISYEAYIQLKDERKAPASSAEKSNWESWLEGGLAKLHMWHFSEVK